MPVETADDRAVFLSPADFGIAAQYRRRDTLVVSTLNGIFDNEYAPLDAGGEMVAASSVPSFVVRTQDLPQDGVYGDSIIVAADALAAAGLSALFAGTYTIRELHPDGTGMTALMLERQKL